MSKSYNLTEEQLNFISFMKGNFASSPNLRSRLEVCLNRHSDNKQLKESEDFDSQIMVHHSPKKMIEFLSLFSRDDNFKWYTHKWDMSVPFDMDSLKSRQIENKNVLNQMVYPKKNGQAINEATYNQVWNFINFKSTGKFSWKNNKLENIRCGWYSIVDLHQKNTDIPIENLKLPDGHQFKDYIRMFKATIEFRTDLEENDRFSELIYHYITSILPKDFKVTFSESFDEIGYDLNIYCDVIGILSGINIICNWIVRHKAISSEVEIDLTSNDDCYILEIIHCGSHFNNIEKLKNPSGDFENLRKRLFSVCDFSMIGDFFKDGIKHGAIKVMALDKDVKMVAKKITSCEIETSNKEIGGVKYQLKIYKR